MATAVGKTYSAAREDMIELCLSEVGLGEHPAGSNRNKQNRWFFGYDLSAPYCASGLSWAAHHSGNSAAAVKSAWVPTFTSWAKSRGRWVSPKNIKRGHWVVYEGGKHIGLALSSVDKDGNFRTVEFNTSRGSTGSQANGWYNAVRNRNIWGGYRPDGALNPFYGLTTSLVKGIQTELNKRGHKAGSVDGKMGPATMKAVKAFQASVGLTADGFPGPDTQRALGGAVRPSEAPRSEAKPPKAPAAPKPSKGKREASWELLKVDGQWGPALNRAFQAYLKAPYKDGVMSRQPQNSVTAAIRACSRSAITFESAPSEGSPYVKLIQRWVGVKQDGRFGVDTYKALQRKMKAHGFYSGPIDGELDRPSSNGVKALQRFLNSRR